MSVSQKYLKQLQKPLTQLKLDNNTLDVQCNFTKVQLKYRYALNIPRVLIVFYQFYSRNKGKTGNLLKCVKIYGKWININGT